MNPVRRFHEVGQATTAVVEIHPKKTLASKELLLVTNFVHHYRGSFFVWGWDEEESTPNLKRLRGRSFCKPA